MAQVQVSRDLTGYKPNDVNHKNFLFLLRKEKPLDSKNHTNIILLKGKFRISGYNRVAHQCASNGSNSITLPFDTPGPCTYIVNLYPILSYKSTGPEDP